ncbi:MAG: NAD-dependent epimerase/dehydratase family protein [Pirellulales bacterium]|nr:NAD-dependent epimerase/dehydratase family protein [Pirellulales bacterium]
MNFWQGKSVLVTGGCGFIGSFLVRELVQLGSRVRVADNLERGHRESLGSAIDKIDMHEVDLRDLDTCRRACVDMDVVFHLASKVGGIGYYLEKPWDVLHSNMTMDGHILTALVEAGVPHYFYASSAHIYPIELQMDIDATHIREEQAYPANPSLSYGWAKLTGEKAIEAVLQEGHKVRASIARIVGAYGPGQDLDLATGSAIPVFCRRAVEYPQLAPFRLLGTGKETRTYCYIDDVVRGIMRSTEKLQHREAVGPYNLGSPDLVSIGELAETIIDISGKSIQIEYETSHPTKIWGQAPDCSYVEELLDGWRPTVTLREGLQRCYDDVQQRLAAISADGA